MRFSRTSCRAFRTGLGVGLAALALAAIPHSRQLRAADHFDAPALRPDSGGFDLLDVYCFQSPETPANTVMISTMNFAAGVATPTFFQSGARYEFRIGEDATAVGVPDPIEDSVYTFQFKKPAKDGKQTFIVMYRGTGANFTTKGEVGTTLTLPNGGKVLCRKFDDPFFFDLIAFRSDFAFSDTNPVNFFRGLDCMGIVLEVPSATFENPNISFWMTSSKGKKQQDRNGRPAINTALVPGPRKDEFNRTRPRDDVAKFRQAFIDSITALGNAAGAAGLADTLLPDVITFNTADAGGFLNGRRLEDDVIDAELNLLTAGAITSDFVDNDSAFLAVFPYLAPANK